ncbi:MAG: hypothetical protein WA705_01530 [Candidatus Ozemobacteraceae bacterium]
MSMMHGQPRFMRIWTALFAVWLAFEPLAISIVHAQEVPAPKVNRETVGGIVPLDEVMLPGDYVKYLLEIRGRDKREVEAQAWSDWLMQMSNVYMMMDAGAHEVFTFYSGVRSVFDVVTTIPDGAGIIPQSMRFLSLASRRAAMLSGIVLRTRPSVWVRNLVSGFSVVSGNASQRLSSFKAFRFLEFMYPPECWVNPEAAEKGMSAWYNWVRRTGGNQEGAIQNFQGVARTVGIGLTVLGFFLDSYAVATSDDTHGGRFFSYDNVKHQVYAVIGLAILVCMFVPPPFGQIAGFICMIWSVLTFIGDLVGPEFKRWNVAYANSYWYLYENDPEFRIFYDHRTNLKKEEKSASLLIAERDFGSVLTGQAPSNQAEKDIFERGKRVYDIVEKQGVLVTYYNQTGFTLPDFDMKRLTELWRNKASYMAWKPTEEEVTKDKNAGFFGKLCDTLNPMNAVRSVENQFGSKAYKNDIKNKEIKRVFFNPDYVLLKKYKNYLIGKGLKGGTYDLVGLRMEQAPFNYIPMLSIEAPQWSEELFQEAFNADSLIIGSKEMRFFREQAKKANEQIQKAMEGNDKMISNLSGYHLPALKAQRETLSRFLDAYRENKTKALSADLRALLYRNCKISWSAEWGAMTPTACLEHYREEFEKALQFIPLTLGKHAIDLIQLDLTLKKNLDTAALMEAFGREREQSLADFETEFKNPEFKKYLKEGKFLDINGSSFFNWLSQSYPVYEEMDKYTKLFMNEVKTYSGKASEANTDTRDGFLWFDSHVKEPDLMLRAVNDELAACKKVVEGYAAAKDEMGLTIAFSSDDADSFAKVFPEGGFKMIFGKEGRTPLDPTVPLAESPTPAK